MTRILPYGEWPSPITPEAVVAASVSISGLQVAGPHVFWGELRPAEGGRVQVVRRRPDGSCDDLLPDGFSARTRVHEYGGGAWLAAAGWLYFANWSDQRLYRLRIGPDGAEGDPEPITPEPAAPSALRYADMRLSGPYVVCVRERHEPGREAVNEVVAVDVRGHRDVTVLASGSDFVSDPRISPGGDLLAYVRWNHPSMPWDSTELCLAAVVLTDGGASLASPLVVAGGPGESVIMPVWHPNGVLHFVSDRTGWWNVYRLDGATGAVEPVTDLDAEIGIPPWVFGNSRFGFLADGRMVFTYVRDGLTRVAVRGTDGTVVDLDLPFTEIGSTIAVRDSSVVLVGGSFTAESAVVEVPIEADRAGEPVVLRPPRDLDLEAAWFSVGEPVSFPSHGRAAHAIYYPPTNPDVAGPEDSAPPLLVVIHGGPTSMARALLSLGVQYWTSRGFAVVDVNYGGSTGYGREYRDLLQGSWGVVDVEDCVAAARWLADQGLADPDRLCIRGGSAGGFTTLAALAFTDTFAAGASSYGVADLSALAEETHKFEARYLDGLVGPYPESKAVYDERSPIHHVDLLDRPLIVFQGLEDEVVPPNQSEMIVEALRTKGVPVAYLAFEGEQHGFRRAETVTAVLAAELYFYGRVLGFTPAGELTPVPIDNLA